MVITISCPSCQASFPVDPDKIPAGGVRVRCSACAHVFRVEKPEPEVAVATEPEAAVASEPDSAKAPEPEGAVASGPETAQSDGWSAPEPEAAEPEVAPTDGWDAPEAVAAEPEAASEPGPEIDVPAEDAQAPAPELEGAPAATSEAGETFDFQVDGSEPSDAAATADQGTPEAAESPAAQEAWRERDPFEQGPAADLAEDATGDVSRDLATDGASEPAAGDLPEFTTEAVPEPVADAEPEADVLEPVADASAEAAAAVPEPAADPGAPPSPSTEDGTGPGHTAQEQPSAAPVQGFTFGKRDPTDKARRLARVLVSDMIMYNAERHQIALAQGTLAEDFEEEIDKSWKEYVDQVGPGMAEGDGRGFWVQALNDILAKGRDVF